MIVTQASYQLIFFACSYLLPLMAISGLYVRMIMRLWHQGSGVQMSVKSQRGRKRVTRLVVVVVVAFASLWLPVQVSRVNAALRTYFIRLHTNLLIFIKIELYAFIYFSWLTDTKLLWKLLWSFILVFINLMLISVKTY